MLPVLDLGPVLRAPGQMRLFTRKGKKEGNMSWGWRDLAVLTFLVLLFGTAMMANVSDGPMRQHRGSWVTHAMR
jgi:hypothetical protein